MKLWDTRISNKTEKVTSMPRWYARVAVVDTARATLKNGSLDLSNASTHFAKGDKVMFVPCNTFEEALKNDSGLIFTVKEVTPSNHYTFEETSVPQGLHFVVKVMLNDDLQPADIEAIVPVTVEAVEADKKDPKHPLANVGLKQPGWYRWRKVTRENRQPMIVCELLVSTKGLHTPDGTSSSAGESFQPGAGLESTDGQVTFAGEDGHVILG